MTNGAKPPLQNPGHEQIIMLKNSSNNLEECVSNLVSYEYSVLFLLINVDKVSAFEAQMLDFGKLENATKSLPKCSLK